MINDLIDKFLQNSSDVYAYRSLEIIGIFVAITGIVVAVYIGYRAIAAIISTHKSNAQQKIEAKRTKLMELLLCAKDEQDNIYDKLIVKTDINNAGPIDRNIAKVLDQDNDTTWRMFITIRDKPYATYEQIEEDARAVNLHIRTATQRIELLEITSSKRMKT
jgi:hypothetical protein